MPTEQIMTPDEIQEAMNYALDEMEIHPGTEWAKKMCAVIDSHRLLQGKLDRVAERVRKILGEHKELRQLLDQLEGSLAHQEALRAQKGRRP